MSYKILRIVIIVLALVSTHGSSALANPNVLELEIGNSIFSKKPKESKSPDHESMPDLLVFVSFSMPEQSLTQLSEQVKKAKGVLVIRGLYKSSMKETVSKIYELNKQGTPAIIHPKLFQQYSVNKVPTIVLSDRGSLCIQENNCTVIHDKLIGNVPLSYSLRLFAKDGYNIELAKRYLKALEGIHD